MRLLLCLCAVLAPALAQVTEPKPAAKGDSSLELGPVFIRRFSLGGTFSYLPLSLIYADSYAQTLTATSGYVSATAKPQSHRGGGGVTMQFALSEHFALNVNALYRSTGYTSTFDYKLGFDKPATATDERNSWGVVDTARARYWDLPVLLRYYSGGRHSKGGHYFIEAGPSFRLVRSARLSRDITDAEGDIATVDLDYGLKRRNIPGVTVGLGRQFIDPFGIRIVPELRFTQWLGSTFNTAPVRSTKSQAEILISITF